MNPFQLKRTFRNFNRCQKIQRRLGSFCEIVRDQEEIVPPMKKKKKKSRKIQDNIFNSRELPM